MNEERQVQTEGGAAIFVKFTEEGFHCWPQAPDHRAYLRAEHRHVFHVTVELRVYHDEREIEFHDLMAEARALFKALHDGTGCHSGSCEAMARVVANQLAATHDRMVLVTVSEDGECGARVQARTVQATRSSPTRA